MSNNLTLTAERENNTIHLSGRSELLNYSAADSQKDTSSMSFRDLLAYNVLHFPDKPVLKSRGTVYTWADIDLGASVIASELYALGVKKRTHAAICGTNSVNWILTFWAVQKLGAVAVLVNPALTAEEIIKLAHTGDIEFFCYGKMPVPLRTYCIIEDGELSGFPARTAGEILVQSHGLMCSYYKVPPEQQPFDDEGYLHTGDLGFLDDEGYLHFAGRIKELIIR